GSPAAPQRYVASPLRHRAAFPRCSLRSSLPVACCLLPVAGLLLLFPYPVIELPAEKLPTIRTAPLDSPSSSTPPAARSTPESPRHPFPVNRLAPPVRPATACSRPSTASPRTSAPLPCCRRSSTCAAVLCGPRPGTGRGGTGTAAPSRGSTSRTDRST